MSIFSASSSVLEAVAVQPVLPVYQVREHPCASDGGGHLLDIVQGGLEPVHLFHRLLHRTGRIGGIDDSLCRIAGVGDHPAGLPPSRNAATFL